MKVSFHILQSNEAGKTRELPLFSDDYAEMMNYKQFEYEGQKFQIKDLEWIDEKRTELKAVCLEIKQEKS